MLSAQQGQQRIAFAGDMQAELAAVALHLHRNGAQAAQRGHGFEVLPAPGDHREAACPPPPGALREQRMDTLQLAERNLRFLQRAARHLEHLHPPRVSASMVSCSPPSGWSRRAWLMRISWPTFMRSRARPMMRLAQWMMCRVER